MNKWDKFLKWISIILGTAALGFFIFDFVLFENIRPRMVVYEAIPDNTESLIILTGVGLLLFLIFCLASLLRTMNYIRRAKKVKMIYIVLIVCGVVSVLFIFGDIALLSDIGKQYTYGLSQPEWYVLYPVMGFQVATALLFLYFHLYQFLQDELEKEITFDNNIFMTVQFIGLLCGFIGLSTSLLGYFFPKAWTLKSHTTSSLISLLLPYGVSVGYWLLNKIFGKERKLYDEKQSQDIGKSAFVTLILSAIFMTGLFIFNYNDLGGVTSILWLPIFLYFILLTFSSGNIYLNWRE